MKRKLIYKSKYIFVYECEKKGYTSVIEIGRKDTDTYKGIQVMSCEKGVNADGFNNAVGMRRNDLLCLPFMIMHFKLYRLFHGGEVNHD